MNISLRNLKLSRRFLIFLILVASNGYLLNSFNKSDYYYSSNDIFDTERENLMIAQSTGHYPATFSFENEADSTSGTSIGFIDTDSSGSGNIATIISTFSGHEKVLELHDIDGDLVNIFDLWGSTQPSGTLEWWWAMSDVSKAVYFQLWDSSTALFATRIYGGTFNYYGGATWTIISTAPIPQNNIWYHMRIDFESTTNNYMGLSQWQFNVWINGVKYGPYSYVNNAQPDRLRVSTRLQFTSYYCYVDAVGYSWDINYTVGDNIIPIPEEPIITPDDSDGDGLTDILENNTYFTDPFDVDSDDDFLSDYAEVMIHLTNPNDPDSDDDMLSDYAEVITHLTNPNDPDSDGDTLSDYEEVMTYSTNPNNPDSDGDTLSDYEEVMTYSTNPNSADTDGDGYNDGAEILNGTDPNNPLSNFLMIILTFLIPILVVIMVSIFLYLRLTKEKRKEKKPEKIERKKKKQEEREEIRKERRNRLEREKLAKLSQTKPPDLHIIHIREQHFITPTKDQYEKIMNENTKVCPFCGQINPTTAKTCKDCKSIFES